MTRSGMWRARHAVLWLRVVGGLALLLSGIVPPVHQVAGQATSDPPCCISDLSAVVLQLRSLPSQNYAVGFEGPSFYLSIPSYDREYVARSANERPLIVETSIFPLNSRSEAADAFVRLRADWERFPQSVIGTQRPALGDDAYAQAETSCCFGSLYVDASQYASQYGRKDFQRGRLLILRVPYVIWLDLSLGDTSTAPQDVLSQVTALGRIVLDQLDAEIAKQIAALPSATPTAVPQPVVEYILPDLVALRDALDTAVAASDRAAVVHAAQGLQTQVVKLAGPPLTGSPADALAYSRTTREWAELLLGGASQAWADLWRQNVQALAGAGDFDGLTAALAEAQAQLDRLNSLVPASLLAGWYQQAVANLTGQIAAGQAIVAGMTTVDDTGALGWGTVLVFPALTDLPIDAGLLPVPQEFQVVDSTTGQAYYNVPPNALLNVARLVGPSCGTYPSPYGASRGVVRWGTYGYSGCFNASPAGAPAQLVAVDLPQPTATPVAEATATRVPPTPTRAAATATPTPRAATATPTVSAASRWDGAWSGNYTGSATSQQGPASCALNIANSISITMRQSGDQWSVDVSPRLAHLSVTAGVCSGASSLNNLYVVHYDGPIAGLGDQLVLEQTIPLGTVKHHYKLMMRLTGDKTATGTLEYTMNSDSGSCTYCKQVDTSSLRFDVTRF